MIYPVLFVSMCMFVNELGPNKIKIWKKKKLDC